MGLSHARHPSGDRTMSMWMGGAPLGPAIRSSIPAMFRSEHLVRDHHAYQCLLHPKRCPCWFFDCSLGTTRNSSFTIFLRFLIPTKSPTCSDSPRRRILTFWTRAQMRQKDRDQFARHVLACSWRSVSSHGSSLSRPGWSQISWVRMVRCLTQGD